MIIVNQERTEIINFDRITEIVVSGNEVTVTDDVYNEYGETIGIYKTEDRAKEVLQEICKLYPLATIYPMPEE